MPSQRPSQRRRLRIALVCVLGLAALVGLHLTLKKAGVAALDRAPNFHRQGVDRPALDGELRVSVSSPPANLAVEIAEPVGGEPVATAFVLHGIRDSRASMRGFATALNARGVRVVLVDSRGHGRSSGDWLTYGVVESRDLKQVLDALSERHLVAGKVGVLGFSYGASTAIEWAAIDPRVAAVVAIAPFASLREVVTGYLPIPLPKRFVEESIAEAGREAGFDPDQASPERAIATNLTPVLIIHGETDSRIPVWHARHIAAAGAGHSELIVVPNEDHMSIAADRSGTIRERGLEWLTRRLR